MADRSLDDIIKERKFSGGGRRGRGRGQNNAARGGGGVRGRFINQGRQAQTPSSRGRGQGVAQRGVKRKIDGTFQRNSGGLNREVSSGLKGRLGINAKPITDARQKLIAKAHQTDARQKLIQKAKHTDARARLNAKRVKPGPKKNEETARSSNSGGLTRTISNEKGGRMQPLQLSVQNKSPQTQFVVRNTNSEQQFTVRNTSAPNLTVRKRISPPRKSGSGEPLQFVVRNNSRENSQPSGPLSFASSQQVVSTKRQPITLKLRADSENTRIGGYGDVASSRLQHRMGTSGPIVLNMKGIATSGPLVINSSPRTKSVPSVDGTRVLISNLHSTVTEEDIKELFGALGILKRVRMMKQGTAEVVYSKRESALKSISTYHNRELDGKAMQCRLDTSSVADGAPFKKNALSDRFKTYSSDNNPTLPYRSTISASTVVELGDEIVDKVLFKLPVASAASSKPVIFTVKI